MGSLGDLAEKRILGVHEIDPPYVKNLKLLLLIREIHHLKTHRVC